MRNDSWVKRPHSAIMFENSLFGRSCWVWQDGPRCALGLFESDFPFIKLCTPENTFLYLHYHYRYFLVVLFCFVFINFCHVYKRVLERIKSKRWEDGFIILLTLFYLVKLFDSQTKIVILLTINHTILMMFGQRIEFWIN